MESKLNEAKKNSVKERTAIRLTTAEVNRRKVDNPDLKGEDLRKVQQRTLSKYRDQLGSVSRRNRSINISDDEWSAIQAGAITENKLKSILNNSNADVLRDKAMPSNRKNITSTQINRIKAMANSNFTLNQIAEKLGISKATVSNYLKGE